MRLLLVTRCLPLPLHLGDRLIVHGLLDGLRARGHDIDLVALTTDDDGAFIEPSAALCPGLETVPDCPRTPAELARRLLVGPPTSADAAWNPRLWTAVERRMASRHYDVVHLVGGIQVYELASLVQRAPTVITPYESHSLLLSRLRDDARGLREQAETRVALPVARAFERVMFRGFGAVVVLAEPDRTALQALAPDLPLHVVPNGVALPEGVVRDGDGRTLVFVGNYAYGPNVRAAAALVDDILPRVRAAVPDARVALVGPGAPAAVTRLAGPAVQVVGYVPDLAAVFSTAACFAAYLTQGAGLKNKVLEAMAHAVPLVTTSIGADGIALVDGEHAFVRDGVEPFAAAIVDLLRDRDGATLLGARGRRLAEAQYGWAGVTARYEQIYERVRAAFASSGGDR